MKKNKQGLQAQCQRMEKDMCEETKGNLEGVVKGVCIKMRKEKGTETEVGVDGKEAWEGERNKGSEVREGGQRTRLEEEKGMSGRSNGDGDTGGR